MSNPAPGFERHPAHRVDIAPAGLRIRVEVGARTVADSSHALRVEESRHGPVYYLPKADVDFSCLVPTESSTYCPFKGHASYWSVVADDGTTLADCVWAYEDPYDECSALAGHVAFYQDRVRLTEEGAAAL